MLYGDGDAFLFLYKWVPSQWTLAMKRRMKHNPAKSTAGPYNMQVCKQMHAEVGCEKSMILCVLSDE